MPTKISWTDETWNPVIGCTKCSPGCTFCYAEKMACRLNEIFAAKGDNDNWADYSSILKFDYSEREMGRPIGWNGSVCLRHNQLDKPLHWRKGRKIFVCSMSDLFHPKVPFEFIDRVYAVAALCPQHTLMILTKRIERALEYCCNTKRATKIMDAARKIAKGKGPKLMNDAAVIRWPVENVPFGLSISTQEEADKKIPILLQIPAAVRILSIEPILEPIDIFIAQKMEQLAAVVAGRPISHIDNPTPLPDWVIIGAESKGAHPGRECKIEWVRSLVQQVQATGVPVFVKQLHIDGKLVKDINKFPPDLRLQEQPA